MKVEEILDINTIKVHFESTTKEGAISELTQVLKDNNYIDDVVQFEKDIYNREAQGQTGIGNYIAIPHGLSSTVKKVGVAIGISKEEIEWETLDDNGVKVIILFSVSDETDGATNHLKLLSTFARKLGNDEVIEALLKSEKAEDVITSFTQ